jgi:hypothetical protein
MNTSMPIGIWSSPGLLVPKATRCARLGTFRAESRIEAGTGAKNTDFSIEMSSHLPQGYRPMTASYGAPPPTVAADAIKRGN